MLEPQDAAHADVLLEAFARRELGLRQEELAWMTDGELALAVKAWQYSEGRRRYVEQYAEQYRAWEAEQGRRR